MEMKPERQTTRTREYLSSFVVFAQRGTYAIVDYLRNSSERLASFQQFLKARETVVMNFSVIGARKIQYNTRRILTLLHTSVADPMQ